MGDLTITGEWEGLDEAFAALEKECTAIVRGITIEAWNYVLRQTPQFWGDAVASWTFTVGSPTFVDRSDYVDHPLPNAREEDDPPGYKFRFNPEDVKQKGHRTGIDIANGFVGRTPWKFRLGQDVYFANGVGYAGLLEDGTVRLRSVNRPGQMVSRALDHIQSAYGEQVSPRSVNRLKELSIG